MINGKRVFQGRFIVASYYNSPAFINLGEYFEGNPGVQCQSCGVLLVFSCFDHLAYIRRGDIAQWLESQNYSNPKTLGFHPLAGQDEDHFVLSLRVNPCADLFEPDPPSRVLHAPKCVRTLRIQYPSVVNE